MKKSLLVRLGVWVAASLFTVIMCLFFPQKLRQMLGREPDYQQKAFAGRQLVASVYGQYIFSDQLYLALKDYLQTRKLQWEQLSDERKKNIFTALLYDLQNAELMSIKAELNKQQVVQDVQLRDKLLQDYSQRFADDNSRDRALAEVNLQWPQLQARLESILLQAARLQQISPDFEQALQQQQASYLKQNAGQILQAATYNCRLLSIPKSDSAQAGQRYAEALAANCQTPAAAEALLADLQKDFAKARLLQLENIASHGLPQDFAKALSACETQALQGWQDDTHYHLACISIAKPAAPPSDEQLQQLTSASQTLELKQRALQQYLQLSRQEAQKYISSYLDHTGFDYAQAEKLLREKTPAAKQP